MSDKRNKISNKEKISYGIGAIGKDMCYAIVGSYFMLYSTDVLGISAGILSTILFAARFWDAINDLAMGVLIDNTKTRWGKFRPWLLVGTLINAVVLVLLYKNWGLSGTQLVVTTAVLYVLWGMTYTIMDIPYWSMLANFSTDKEEREKMAVVPRICASLGGLLVGSFGLQIVNFFGKTDEIVNGVAVIDRHHGFYVFAIIVAVVFVICTLITCFNVKSADGNTNSSQKAEKTSFKQMLKVITQNDQLLVAILTILSFNFATQMMANISTYYFIYVAGSEALFTTFVLFAGVSEMTGLFLFPKIAKHISRKACYLIATILPIVGLGLLLTISFIAPQNGFLTALSGIILKFGAGLQLGIVTIALADVVDYAEYKFGARNEGIIFSLQTLLVKITAAFSTLIGGFMLSATGYVANAQQSATTLNGMRFVMCVLPAIFIVISFVVYKKFYKLEGQYFEDIMHKLNERRQLAKQNEQEAA